MANKSEQIHCADISHEQIIKLIMNLTREVGVLDKKINLCMKETARGSKKKDEIKKDLIDQLERNGVVGNQYQDLVDDYMALWDIKNKLIKDIRARGVSVEWRNGGGQGGVKKNESIAELNKTNAQMLKILSDLGLKASRTEVKDDDEEM